MTSRVRLEPGTGWVRLADDYRDATRELGAPVVQDCVRCGTAFWPPRLRCSCGASEMRWSAAGLTGRLVSTVGVDLRVDQGSERRVPRRLAERLPYTTVIVELEEHPGVRMALLSDGLALTTAPSGTALTLAAEVDGDAVTLVARSVEG